MAAIAHREKVVSGNEGYAECLSEAEQEAFKRFEAERLGIGPDDPCSRH